MVLQVRDADADSISPLISSSSCVLPSVDSFMPLSFLLITVRPPKEHTWDGAKQVQQTNQKD